MVDRRSGRKAEPLPTPGIVRRLLCLLYEALLLTAVGFAATLVFLAAVQLAGVETPRPLLQVYLLLVAGGYFVPQWRAGQTLPMRTWRIRVVSAAGEPLTAKRAVVRYVLAVLSSLLLGAGYVWALADPDRQFLHDRLARTRLIAVPR